MSDNPLAALWSTPNTGALYPGLLKSNSVVDMVLKNLDLQKVYGAKDIEKTRTILRNHMTVSSDTAGFYTLAVTDRDPTRAKAIVSQFMEGLAQINVRLALDEARQERIVYEHELSDAKDQLGKAEEDLAAMQTASGVVSAQSQTQAGLAAINQLRAQITAYEVDLAAMLKAETEEAPSVVKLRAQIEALQAELQSMEKGRQGEAGAGLSAARAPEANLEFLRLQREVQYRQALYEIVTKQFESTQLQAISTPGAQVVDYPEQPLRKAKPLRSLWALGGAAGCFVFALITIFIEDRYRVIQRDPSRHAQLVALSDAAKHPGLRIS
jgi:capsule polysaccharide export protein KpsE/RkpR